MADPAETFARHLVRALYHATDGEERWWSLPNELNDATRQALECAVARGWLLMLGNHSVCLTDDGRELVRNHKLDA
jgi:hypothetical protein